MEVEDNARPPVANRNSFKGVVPDEVPVPYFSKTFLLLNFLDAGSVFECRRGSY